jgi:predicted RNase H-like HicB family nuclease
MRVAKRVYFGVIEAGSGGYSIFFPDFPGCVSAGDSLEELARMGAEALQFHVDAMVEDGELIPEPGVPNLEAERVEVPGADLRGLLAIEVDVPIFPRTVAVPLDTELVQAVDRLASSRHQFIADATRRELERRKRSA